MANDERAKNQVKLYNLLRRAKRIGRSVVAQIAAENPVYSAGVDGRLSEHVVEAVARDVYEPILRQLQAEVERLSTKQHRVREQNMTPSQAAELSPNRIGF